jgi:glycosyltransferase involved in cell wall biosynthesis
MAEPIGVLHVVDCLNVGGTERQMVELLRRLDRRRWRPLVACFKVCGELVPAVRGLGIDPIEFPLHGSLMRLGTLRQIARMALLCRREKVRIVHAHDFYANVFAVPAAQAAGAHVVASRRDLGHWLSPLQRRALGLACRAADCVIANATAVGELVIEAEGVAPGKLSVVPNGIDIAAFDARAAADPALPPVAPSARRIAMVGSMHLPDKGHGDLLEAAALLRARGRRLQWLLISDGVLRSGLEERARALGLAEEVRFLGRRGDVPAILSRVDLVVHPSWAEGFPNVLLEAMCARRPVVATRVGGCPEVVSDDTGRLVEPRQPSRLADAIDELLADPAGARELGRRGRRVVEARYSLDRMSDSVEDLYARLVRRAPDAAAAAAAK